MFETLVEFVQAQLRDNQFFSGGAVLMIAGAVMASLRAVPGRIWRWCCSQFMIEVDILDRDPAFDWMEQWLAQHRYAQRRARRLSIRSRPLEFRERQADPTGDHRPRILFTPAPGRHFLFYRGRPVLLNRERPPANQVNQQPLNVRETFHLTVFTRDRRVLQQLLDEVRDVALPPGDDQMAVYCVRYAEWGEQMKRSRRPQESVVLRQGTLEDLLSDCKWFLENRLWYVRRGIPYRRGYLLYGPPGTGKSSAVLAVASALRMDIAILNLTSSNLEDRELSSLLAELPANSILLIEDIDCVFVQPVATDDKRNRVTFSGLLNALDGVAAGESRMLFATTNHRERLDVALTRPGRIDREIEIGYADRDQLRRMFLRFYDNCDPVLAEAFATGLPEARLSMSAVQSYLIEHAHSPDTACVAMGDWLVTESSPQWQSQAGQDTERIDRGPLSSYDTIQATASAP